jgi:hypothetical protein
MRATVKTWLKSQEKAKSDGQDKPDVREESTVVANLTIVAENGDVQADAPVTVDATADEQVQPQNGADIEEVQDSHVQPSIEVSQQDRTPKTRWLTGAGTGN